MKGRLRVSITAVLLGVLLAAPAPAQQPDEAPLLQNGAELSRLLAESIPPQVRRALGGAGIVVRARVREDGSADSLRVRVSSGFVSLDNSARRAAEAARFPARPGAPPTWTDVRVELDEAESGSGGGPWATSAANRNDVVARLQGDYPADLSRGRITARAEVLLTVSGDGRVQSAELASTSCFPAVDELALDGARALQFAPADAGTAPRRALATATFRRDTVRLRLTGDTITPPVPGRVTPGPRAEGEDRRPELRNRSAVASTLRARYPQHLYNAGIGGTPVVWLYISETGEIIEIQISRSGGLCEIDRTALDVATTMQFRPALSDGVPIPLWVEIPLTFNARGSGRREP